MLLTRSAADNAAAAARLRAALRRRGLAVEICALPTTAIALLAATDAPALAVAARTALQGARGLALTSRHGAAAALSLLGGPALQAFRAGGGAIACVGPACAAALRAAGVGVDLVAAPATADALAVALATVIPAGSAVVYLCGDLARPALAEGLRRHGIGCTALVAYHNAAASRPAPARAAKAAGADWVVIFAPSAARRLYDWLPALRQRPTLAVGPTTAAALRAEHGVEAVAVAEGGGDGWCKTLADLVAAARRDAAPSTAIPPNVTPPPATEEPR